MKKTLLILCSLALTQGAALAAETSTSRGACSSSEKWKFGSDIGPQWQEEFEGFVSGKFAPVRGFSQGLALRRQAQPSTEQKIFGEYWVARALYEAKMVHVAFHGFALIAAYPVVSQQAGVQTAALECLNRIYQRYPTVGLPQAVTSKLKEYFERAHTDSARETVWEYASNHLTTQLAANKPKSEILQTMELLKGAGEYEALAFAQWSAKNGAYQATIEQLKRFFANSSLPKRLERFKDHAHILMSRAYFTLGQFDKASVELKHVQKRSNQLAEALSELSWSFLQNEKYSEAIGAALNLQAGGLRHTFAPEGPMVMAMALNEICQYPESLRAVSSFRRSYEKSFRWLDAWATQDKRGDLYSKAVQFLRKQGDVPDRVGSEWVRSPYFIAHQDEINLIFDERDSSTQLGRSGAREQRKLAQDARAFWNKLKPKIQALRRKMKPGEELPGSVRLELARLKYQITAFRRLWFAAPAWRAILSTHQKLAPTIEKKLVRAINEDLGTRSLRMLVQLQEVAENNQLIEVEIYNGASQDIIWQNAHPEYKELAKKMSEEQKNVSTGKVWDWGRSVAAENEDAVEIWEDELGSFKADLFDNCSSKDKYLAIRRQQS